MDVTVVSLYMFAHMCKNSGVRLHAFVSHMYLAHVCVCNHDAACFSLQLC